MGLPLAIPRPLLEGTLKRICFADLLQALSHGEPCQVLFLDGNWIKGFVWISGKIVVRARTPGRHGIFAFQELFEDGESGGFRVFPLPASEIPAGEILGELDALLVRAVWAKDTGANSGVITIRFPEASLQERQKECVGWIMAG